MLAMEKTLNLRIPSDVHEQLSELTRATGRSKSFLALEALQSYLSYQTWQLAEIQDGLAEAERGEFASDEEIARILNKYA
jgi:RHH-type transcriptional regulator, rel operon repressor / antitoxin RelB